MLLCDGSTLPVMISPPPIMLDRFLRTGSWPPSLPLLPVITDQVDKDESAVPLAAAWLGRI